MKILIEKLAAKLDRYLGIYIWGTGQYGKNIYMQLCNEGLREKVKSFLVTGNPLDKEIDCVPVISVEELRDINEDYVILVAVLNPQFLEEIQNEISCRDYSNIVMLKHYCIKEYSVPLNEERRFLREKSFTQMLDYMTESYIYNEKEREIDYKSARNYLSQLTLDRTCADDKEIVFIVGTVYIRTSRIAIALKKSGYIIKIIQISNGKNQYAGEYMLLENGIKIEKCISIAELLYKSLEEKPLVYYIDPPWLDSSLAMFVIYNKNKFGKIIFGEYDVQRIAMYYLHPEYYYLTEQYALENADGVVWRYDAQNYMECEYGYHYKGKSIHFYDYCDDIPGDNFSDDDPRLKLCMLPSHIHNHLVCGKINDKYTHDASLFELIDLVADREDCLLDIYIWAYFEEDVLVCNKIENEHSNIRFFYRIPHTELLEKMKWYDYGLYLFKENSSPLYLDLSIYNYATKGAYYCATCNKYFDYLAAGLPIVASLPKFQIDYLDQFNVVVKMNIDDFDIEYLKKNKKRYRAYVKKALPQLLIDNQIYRLVEFIENIGRK